MGHKMMRWAAVIICVLAAGICYSCSRAGAAGQEELLLPGAKEAGGEALADRPEGSEPGESTSEDEAEAAVTGETEDMVTRADEAEAGGQEVQPPPGICYVHVCGEVVSPGVYELAEGSRIYQAVEKAGGFTQQAASEYLNMAQAVSDGMKIVVPDRDSLEGTQVYGEGQAGGAGGVQLTGGGSGGSPTSGGPGASGQGGVAPKVNLNTATKEQLMTLRGIGEARAADIVKYREERGGFQKIEDIMKVSGIKEAAFQKIKDDITV